MEKNFLISIITPNFNRAKFLEKTILSIKNQKYPLVEHIIIDGGSTDRSIEIIKKYEGTYNLKWVSEKDEGCADAMEKGFKLATGDIFCWLDSDDIYLDGAIEKVMKIFKDNPEIDVVFGDMLICDQNDKIIDYTKRTIFDKEMLIYIGTNISPQAAFWKREAHEKIGGIDINFKRCADYDFFCRLAESNAKFFHLKDFLAVYRHHPEQLTKSIDLCKLEANQISKKYSDNIFGLNLKFRKIKIYFKRAFCFIKQGDLWYVLRSILKRFKIIK
jgi:glycosyltransferase involved in cell wall biosynthesis